jgi:hypothetical protein
MRLASARVVRCIRDLTILGRQRDGDGQNKLLQINGSKDSSWYIINRMNLIVLELEDMGFMVGKSSAKPSLKLHLLWLGMQPLYQDVKICDLAL